ncbi:uncharacterized protein BcabD6B2_43920 [Babesia caballi]|uniref:Vesicle-fusing ATPase n=1 Tax=Babesia caballi TaxID=5871 RepID=A0AAV4LXL0_BABCB|nr:hypothetical protein BcabD6B2_43920 [Babesia caballi]
MSSTAEQVEKFRVRALKSLELTGLLQSDEIDLICQICTCLNEPNVKLIERVVHRKGVDFCRQVLEDALLALEGGGQRKADGERRRAASESGSGRRAQSGRAERPAAGATSGAMNDEERQQRAVALSQKAIDDDNAGRYREAFEGYLRALDQWTVVCKYQQNPVLREHFVEKMREYVERAETLKRLLREGGSGEAARSAHGPAASGGGAAAEQLELLANAKCPNVKWSDIAGLEGAKQALEEAVMFPMHHPNVFKGPLKPWRGILLYGPPGTGKTYLAQACATEISATFLPISSSDVMSKWQGESEKFVKSLFQVAEQRAPCVIFVDEIDSLCSARSEGDNDSCRRVKTEFLVQMQGVSRSENIVMVLAATNLPWALDSAIIRRFERRIYIPLPDLPARRALLELSLRDCEHQLTKEDLDEIARQTEGYSGSDLNVVVRDACMQPLRKCKDATHFKKVARGSSTMYTPCSPGDASRSKRECGMMSIESNKLLLPPVTRADFVSILAHSRPSVAECDLAAYEEWTNKYGQFGQLRANRLDEGGGLDAEQLAELVDSHEVALAEQEADELANVQAVHVVDEVVEPEEGVEEAHGVFASPAEGKVPGDDAEQLEVGEQHEAGLGLAPDAQHALEDAGDGAVEGALEPLDVLLDVVLARLPSEQAPLHVAGQGGVARPGARSGLAVPAGRVAEEGVEQVDVEGAEEGAGDVVDGEGHLGHANFLGVVVGVEGVDEVGDDAVVSQGGGGKVGLEEDLPVGGEDDQLLAEPDAAEQDDRGGSLAGVRGGGDGAAFVDELGDAGVLQPVQAAGAVQNGKDPVAETVEHEVELVGALGVHQAVPREAPGLVEDVEGFAEDGAAEGAPLEGQGLDGRGEVGDAEEVAVGVVGVPEVNGLARLVRLVVLAEGAAGAEVLEGEAGEDEADAVVEPAHPHDVAEVGAEPVPGAVVHGDGGGGGAEEVVAAGARADVGEGPASARRVVEAQRHRVEGAVEVADQAVVVVGVGVAVLGEPLARHPAGALQHARVEKQEVHVPGEGYEGVAGVGVADLAVPGGVEPVLEEGGAPRGDEGEAAGDEARGGGEVGLDAAPAAQEHRARRTKANQTVVVVDSGEDLVVRGEAADVVEPVPPELGEPGVLPGGQGEVAADVGEKVGAGDGDVSDVFAVEKLADVGGVAAGDVEAEERPAPGDDQAAVGARRHKHLPNVDALHHVLQRVLVGLGARLDFVEERVGLDAVQGELLAARGPGPRPQAEARPGDPVVDAADAVADDAVEDEELGRVLGGGADLGVERVAEGEVAQPVLQGHGAADGHVADQVGAVEVQADLGEGLFVAAAAEVVGEPRGAEGDVDPRVVGGPEVHLALGEGDVVDWRGERQDGQEFEALRREQLLVDGPHVLDGGVVVVGLVACAGVRDNPRRHLGWRVLRRTDAEGRAPPGRRRVAAGEAVVIFVGWVETDVGRVVGAEQHLIPPPEQQADAAPARDERDAAEGAILGVELVVKRQAPEVDVRAEVAVEVEGARREHQQVLVARASAYCDQRVVLAGVRVGSLAGRRRRGSAGGISAAPADLEHLGRSDGEQHGDSGAAARGSGACARLRASAGSETRGSGGGG